MPEWEYSVLRMRSRSLDRDSDDRHRLDSLGELEWELIVVVRNPLEKSGLIGFFKSPLDDIDDIDLEEEANQKKEEIHGIAP